MSSQTGFIKFYGFKVKAILLSFFILVFICLGVNSSGLAISGKERRFLIEERISLKNLPKNSDSLHIWIPYPISDNWQEVRDFRLVSDYFDSSVITDKKYNNKIVYLKYKPNTLSKGPDAIVLSFNVIRKEYSLINNERSFSQQEYFLSPDRLVPINGYMKKLARDLTKDKVSDLERVRAIYNYLIDTLNYAKDDPAICGIGDSLLTLKHKKGICTDYHSLFISLVRSLGIPAKFEIGFRIPQEEGGRLNGYHCWAKFYLKDKGWIPVDISEADKHPEKRDYFFGHIDENRVHFTTGRDIKLKYTKAQPLNFFIYPYVEVNGRQFKDMDIEIIYKEVGDEKNI